MRMHYAHARRLGNCKPFVEIQRLPMRPLTLIFGAGNAGEARLIHALLLACRAAESGELTMHWTIIGGKSVSP